MSFVKIKNHIRFLAISQLLLVLLCVLLQFTEGKYLALVLFFVLALIAGPIWTTVILSGKDMGMPEHFLALVVGIGGFGAAAGSFACSFVVTRAIGAYYFLFLCLLCLIHVGIALYILRNSPGTLDKKTLFSENTERR